MSAPEGVGPVREALVRVLLKDGWINRASFTADEQALVLRWLVAAEPHSGFSFSEVEGSPDRLDEQEKAMMKRAMVYRDRCAAVEKLLACYRTQSQPSERLHRELARTKRALDRLALDPEKE